MTDGDSGGIIERLRNSPRTVSTLIVILIVVGAIFAFSDRGARAPGPAETTVTPAPTSTESPTVSSPDATATVKPGEEPAQSQPSPTPLPAAAEETDTAYLEVAERGNGVTHLARRAMERYLQAVTQETTVTVEHKVWIEDYLKDRLGRKPLALGERLTVEKDLMRDAIAQSKDLTDAQLKHLTRFAQRVAAYRAQTL